MNDKGDYDLSTFNPKKLSVEFRDSVTATSPIFPRRYTLTHSDFTGELYLTIGGNFAWDNVGALRDEVIGEFSWIGCLLYFLIYVYIDQGEYDFATSKKRFDIFKRELPLALTAIRYGDRILFNKFPQLDQANIIVNFISVHPLFRKVENFGEFHHYFTKQKLE